MPFRKSRLKPCCLSRHLGPKAQPDDLSAVLLIVIKQSSKTVFARERLAQESDASTSRGSREKASDFGRREAAELVLAIRVLSIRATGAPQTHSRLLDSSFCLFFARTPIFTLLLLLNTTPC